jgi:hypothetical protein
LRRKFDITLHRKVCPLRECKCGCGQSVLRNRVFVDKQHQLHWLNAGGAAELNAMQPIEVKVRGGQTSGAAALKSGRLTEASRQGAAKVRDIAAELRTSRKK